MRPRLAAQRTRAPELRVHELLEPAPACRPTRHLSTPLATITPSAKCGRSLAGSVTRFLASSFWTDSPSSTGSALPFRPTIPHFPPLCNAVGPLSRRYGPGCRCPPTRVLARSVAENPYKNPASCRLIAGGKVPRDVEPSTQRPPAPRSLPVLAASRWSSPSWRALRRTGAAGADSIASKTRAGARGRGQLNQPSNAAEDAAVRSVRPRPVQVLRDVRRQVAAQQAHAQDREGQPARRRGPSWPAFVVAAYKGDDPNARHVRARRAVVLGPRQPHRRDQPHVAQPGARCCTASRPPSTGQGAPPACCGSPSVQARRWSRSSPPRRAKPSRRGWSRASMLPSVNSDIRRLIAQHQAYRSARPRSARRPARARRGRSGSSSSGAAAAPARHPGDVGGPGRVAPASVERCRRRRRARSARRRSRSRWASSASRTCGAARARPGSTARG